MHTYNLFSLLQPFKLKKDIGIVVCTAAEQSVTINFHDGGVKEEVRRLWILARGQFRAREFSFLLPAFQSFTRRSRSWRRSGVGWQPLCARSGTNFPSIRPGLYSATSFFPSLVCDTNVCTLPRVYTYTRVCSVDGTRTKLDDKWQNTRAVRVLCELVFIDLRG